MKALDEQGRAIIHIKDPDARNESERWIMVMGSDGNPETLIQQYVTTGAHGSESPHVRVGRAIPADDLAQPICLTKFGTSFTSFLKNKKLRRPKPRFSWSGQQC